MTARRWRFPDLTGWTTRRTADTNVAARCVETTTTGIELCIKRNNGLVQEAMISTADSFVFTFGTLRARMTFLGPKGAHSALWLQSRTPYATDADHEVDAAEHFGEQNVQHNLYGRDAVKLFHDGTPVDVGVPHIYEVQWQPDRYVWRVDGEQVAQWVGTTARSPLFPVLSYLSSEWERPALQVDELWRYRTRVYWAEAES